MAALNQGLSINNAANPAPPGSVVALYATGLGAMTPPPLDGTRPPLSVSKPVVAPMVSVNDQPAVIE